MLETRPRLSFDEYGRCSACEWVELKKIIDWDVRRQELIALLEKHRSLDGGFDCVVPVSGGKDGSYVSHKLKTEFNMNPLCVTVQPHTATRLGRLNLEKFIESGFNHITINPHHGAMRRLNKLGLIEMGQPYYGWLLAVTNAPLLMAEKFDCNLVFYGENGEVEYGGTKENRYQPFRDVELTKRVFLEGGYDRIIEESGIPQAHLNFFKFPAGHANGVLDVTYWSHFEDWDPYRNYQVAKNHCGLQEKQENNSGTYTNFAQNDQALYALHAWLMYLKFGFGRATQDACIDIRRGGMDRDQAENLVDLFDGNFPVDHLDTYLDYYELSEDEFFQILGKWTNSELFEFDGRVWRRIFEREMRGG